MDIKYSNYNKPNDRVRQLQYQLNNISDCHSLNWEHLKEDGIYGKRSATIIKKFINWHQQMSLATDGQGLPVLTDALFSEVKRAYDNRPLASWSQPILKPPIATPADPNAYKRMLEAHPSQAAIQSGIVPPPFDKLGDSVFALVESFHNELQLIRDLKNWEPERIIKWYRDKGNPKIKAIKESFDRIVKSTDEYRANHVAQMGESMNKYKKTVQSAYPIGERFDRWLKEADIGKRVDAFMKGKGGDILKGVAKPVKKLWDLKDIIGDLCILAYLIITGEPVDDLWWSRFEKNLYKFIDSLIGTLLGALCVAGLVAVGVLAGPATLVAGLIGLVVAIVFGLVCDGFDFSPTKFFMELIGKNILKSLGNTRRTRPVVSMIMPFGLR